MNRLLGIHLFALGAVLSGAAALGAESDFELADGRSIRGLRTGEEGGVVELLVQAGHASARVSVPRDQIKAIHPVAEGAQEVARAATGEAQPAAAYKPAVELKAAEGPSGAPQAPQSEPKTEGPKQTKEQVFARARELLRAALEESRDDLPAPSERRRSPMPQDLDETYWDVYGPLAEGIYNDNYRALVYREGVLPRTWKYGNTLIFNSPDKPPAHVPGSLPPVLKP